MGRASRNKGAAGERELVNLIRDFYGYDVKRGMVFLGQSDMIGLPGIHPEIKRVERLNVHAAMDQAIREAEKRKDGLPTVFHRRNRTEWLVTMRLTDWMDLYGEWEDEHRDRENHSIHGEKQRHNVNGGVRESQDNEIVSPDL